MADYAADDVGTIAKRLKELEAEKQAILSKPLEDQPEASHPWGFETSGMKVKLSYEQPQAYTPAPAHVDPFWQNVGLVQQPDGSWRWLIDYVDA